MSVKDQLLQAVEAMTEEQAERLLRTIRQQVAAQLLATRCPGRNCAVTTVIYEVVFTRAAEQDFERLSATDQRRVPVSRTPSASRARRR